jgi:hypothetical protein
LNVPKPVSFTASPFSSAEHISSKTKSTIRDDSERDRPNLTCRVSDKLARVVVFPSIHFAPKLN